MANSPILPVSPNSNNPFQKATKAKARLRMAIYGASGSGKTYSSLAIAQSFGKTALIDTERGSASKYADLFNFDVVELENTHPNAYIEIIRQASSYGYDVLIIDSLSHAWQKVLELIDNINKSSKSQNSFTAWRDVTPLQNQFIDTILTAPIHIIATMRSKTEYVMERDERSGKTAPRKVGLAPIQRDGVEYEFDIVGEMNQENDLVIVKTRCPQLNGVSVNKPNGNIGDVLKAWLTDGVDMPEVKSQPTQIGQESDTRPTPPPAPAQSSNGASTGTGSGGALTSQPASDKHPAVGMLDMNTLMRRAYDERLVKGRNHFDNLITLLLNNGDIGRDMTFEQVLEAIRVHEAAKDLAKEAQS